MNAFRNLLRLVVATSLATLALPALAGATPKNYSLLVVDRPTYDTTTGAVNVPVPVTVQLKNEAPPGSANSNISSFTLTATGMTIVNPVSCSIGGVAEPNCSLNTATNTITVTNISPPLQAQQIMTITLGTNSCGDGHWFATVYTGQISGQTFSLVSDPGFATVPNDQITNTSCGPASCSGMFSVPTTTSPNQPGYVQVIRGALNKDGTTCGTTNYFVSNMLATPSGLLHFRWPVSTADTNPQPSAVFQYTVNLPTQNANVAWLNADGKPATLADPSITPYFIPAPSCLTSALPGPYAQLGSGVSTSDTVIQVINSLSNGQLPRRPFPAVIGSERILVLQTSGNGTWTIARAQGGTALATHNATDAVMSTPLPILPAVIGPYKSSTNQPVQAQMCIVGAPVQNAAGFWTATFIDIGDGWTLGR